jgi:hypothetical protein
MLCASEQTEQNKHIGPHVSSVISTKAVRRFGGGAIVCLYLPGAQFSDEIHPRKNLERLPIGNWMRMIMIGVEGENC